MTANKRFLIMAGGTGGHVFPALATARSLRERGHDVYWLGSRDGMEASLVGDSEIPIYLISVSGLRGKGRLTLLAAPFRLTRAVVQALVVVRKVSPDCVIGMGGFVAGPGGLCAWLLRRPLVIHEQNAIAGMTNRWLSRFATLTLEAFPGAFGGDTVTRCTGNPVRADLTALPHPDDRSQYAGPVRILVLGGSRGALAINQAMPAAVAQLPASQKVTVTHQCGADHVEATRQAYEQAGVEAEVVPFIDDMAGAYAGADLVVCRAGALTLAELCAVGVASVLVPFPHAVDDHQTANARHLAQAGAAVLVPQAEMNEQGLGDLLVSLTADTGRLKEMARAARNLARPDATDRVVNYCLETAHG